MTTPLMNITEQFTFAGASLDLINLCLLSGILLPHQQKRWPRGVHALLWPFTVWGTNPSGGAR